MALGSDELEKLADAIYKDRRIAGSVFCGKCGYNLKTLPYVYECPECGNAYNARPRVLLGVFNPHEADFPLRDLVVVGVCALGAVVHGLRVYWVRDWFGITFATIFAVFTGVFGWQAFQRLRRFYRALMIGRRIAAEERNL